MRILDLGVGCGRTSPVLASGAASYVGVDYSPEMIEICRSRFASFEFRVADAANLSEFPGSSFDLVVFSFNGLDYLFPNQTRQSCIREVYRLLEVGGLFIFSSHNARCVFPRADKDTARNSADYIAAKLFPKRSQAQTICSSLASIFALLGLRLSLAYGCILHKLGPSVFWHGDGFFFDPVHGGLHTRATTPRRVMAEMESFKFDSIDLVSSEFPEETSTLTTGWYYYVFRKRP